jgi:hypothetical protein
MSAVSDRRARIVALVAFAAAVCLLVAGIVMWRQMSSQPSCPPHTFCVPLEPAYRLHPLRAVLLWAAAALCAGVGVSAWLTTLRGRRRPRMPGLDRRSLMRAGYSAIDSGPVLPPPIARPFRISTASVGMHSTSTAR